MQARVVGENVDSEILSVRGQFSEELAHGLVLL
jgi:hypothetical protein